MKKVKRTRKYNGKTTTGCVTCKMRRVKCDEGQPNCHRCQSTGRKCDGYSQTKECSKQNIFSLAPLELGEEAEREAFHFFRRQTVRKSAIYFESDFWNRLVLQLCHSEPVIRHAVVALGSLHQRFELTNSVEDGEENSIALHRYTRLQYSKAIAGTHDLVNQNKENALDLTLVVCVLFVCLENFLGDFEAAEIHLDNGFKILANRQHNHQKTPSSTLSIFKETSELLEDDILHQFTRLELQATTFQGDRYREPLVYYDNMMIPLVKHFDCLNVARNELYITLVRLLRLRNAIEGGSNPLAGEQSTDSPDQLMKMIQECSAHLEYWKTAFSRFLERNSSTMDIKTLRAALLLKAHHMLGTVGIAVDQVEGTGGEDAFVPQMDEILSWTESATKGMDGEQSPHTAEFSFELGVIMPLYCVASSCRKPSSRRRAVELLKATPRREGLWDNLAAAAVAQRIIDVEEEGLGEVQYASDIPPSSRVYQTEVDLSFDQRRVDARFTFMPFGRDGPIIERKEVITW